MFGAIFKNAWATASDVGRKAAEALIAGAEKVGAAAEAAKAAAVQKAKEVKEWTVEKAHQAKEKAVEIKDATVKKAVEIKDATVKKAVEVKDAAVKTAKEVKAWAMEKAIEAKNFAVKKANEAKRKAIAVKDAGVKKITEVKDWAVQKTKDSTLDTLRSLGDKAGPQVLKIGSIIDKITPYVSPRPIKTAVLPCPNCEQSSVPDTEKDGKYMVPRDGGGCDVLDSPPNFPPSRDGSTARTITYVNGIMTSGSDHCKTLHEIKAMTGANVFGVYNATKGSIADTLQTAGDRALINAASEGKGTGTPDEGRNLAVDTLAGLIATETIAGNPPEIWAHSQGGAITSLALIDAKNMLGMTGESESLAGVKVTSVGSAAPWWPPGPSYTHFVHIDDPVATGLGIGSDKDEAMKRAGNDANGNPANVIIFSGEAGGPYETENPKKGFISPSSHFVDDSYLPMVKQSEAKSGDPSSSH